MTTFVVPGIPAPQGSFKAISHKTTGKAIMVPGSGGNYLRYRADIRGAAITAMAGAAPRQGALHLTCVFIFPRPESHWLPANTKRPEALLRGDAPMYPTGKPDLDKLCRAVGDALTGICYLDDAQVAGLTALKVYAHDHGQGGSTSIVTIDINDERED